MADEPQSDSRPPDVDLLLDALQREGREPQVFPRSMWLRMTDDERASLDLIVVTDETYAAWLGGEPFREGWDESD